MSISLKGHITTQETKNKISKSNKGKKRTLEQNIANRLRNQNKVWIYKDNIQTTIPKDSLETFIKEGWIRGRLKNSKPAWNKGLTKESDERVAKYTKSRNKHFENGGSIGCFGVKGNQFAKKKK